MASKLLAKLAPTAITVDTCYSPFQSISTPSTTSDPSTGGVIDTHSMQVSLDLHAEWFWEEGAIPIMARKSYVHLNKMITKKSGLASLLYPLFGSVNQLVMTNLLFVIPS